MAGINEATGQTFSNVDSILKDFYLGPVREQLEYSSVLSYRIQKDQESVGGRKVVIPLHIGKNESFTGVGDGGFLPDPGAQSWTTTEFPVKYHYGRLLITGPTISAAKTDKMAFLRTLDAAVKGLTRDMKKEMNRIYHGDGSGRLNAVLTTPAAGAYTSACDVANLWDSSSTNYVQYLRAGMLVALVPTTADEDDKDLATAIGANTIASVDPSSSTDNIVFETAGNVGDTGWAASTSYHLVRASRLESGGATATYKNTSYYKEAMGIKGIVDDGDPAGETSGFQGIDSDAAANSFWRAEVDSTTTAIGFSAMQQMFDNIAKKCEGDRPTLIITDYTQRRKYFELWRDPTDGSDYPGASRRYVNVRKLDGGFEAVEYNGVPIVVDVDATPGHMFFIHEPHLAQFMNEDYFWLDRDGKILHRLEDKDAYQATLARYFEFGCYRRNSHGVMDSLAE